MSPSNMLAKQLRRFRIELAMAALALLASGMPGLGAGAQPDVPLREAIGALRQIRGGDYRVELPVTTGGEVGELQASIGEMSVALDESKKDLENKVAERTRDLLASRNEALRADADKRKLIQKVNSIIEDERKSIAIEIHDELNASLIAVRLEVAEHRHLAAKAAPGPEVEEIRQSAGHHQAGARPVCQRPPPGAAPASRSAGHARPARGRRGNGRHYDSSGVPLRIPLARRFFEASATSWRFPPTASCRKRCRTS
jgi:signal transduction histidine kinase